MRNVLRARRSIGLLMIGVAGWSASAAASNGFDIDGLPWPVERTEISREIEFAGRRHSVAHMRIAQARVDVARLLMQRMAASGTVFLVQRTQGLVSLSWWQQDTLQILRLRDGDSAGKRPGNGSAGYGGAGGGGTGNVWTDAVLVSSRAMTESAGAAWPLNTAVTATATATTTATTSATASARPAGLALFTSEPADREWPALPQQLQWSQRLSDRIGAQSYRLASATFPTTVREAARSLGEQLTRQGYEQLRVPHQVALDHPLPESALLGFQRGHQSLFITLKSSGDETALLAHVLTRDRSEQARIVRR